MGAACCAAEHKEEQLEARVEKEQDMEAKKDIGAMAEEDLEQVKDIAEDIEVQVVEAVEQATGTADGATSAATEEKAAAEEGKAAAEQPEGQLQEKLEEIKEEVAEGLSEVKQGAEAVAEGVMAAAGVSAETVIVEFDSGKGMQSVTFETTAFGFTCRGPKSGGCCAPAPKKEQQQQVFVRDVVKKSEADTSSVRPGWIVKTVDGIAVADVDDANSKLLEASKKLSAK